MENKRYKIIEKTLRSGDKVYVVKQRFLFWFWITHMEDMGLYIEVSKFNTLKKAQDKIEWLTERSLKKKLSKVKSTREIL